MTMRWKVALVEDDRRLARAVSVGLDLAELTADVLRAYASQADTSGVGLVNSFHLAIPNDGPSSKRA